MGSAVSAQGHREGNEALDIGDGLVMVLDVFLLVLEKRLQLGAHQGLNMRGLDGIGMDWLYSSNKMASVTGGT